VKKIYVIAVLLLVAVFVLTAAVPKPGPKIVLTLINRQLTQEAHISLNGLTAFYQYYLTARAWPVDVKYPAGLWDKAQKTTYEIRADFYEGTIYACGLQRSGVFSLKRNTKLVFPLCAKGGANQGEPYVEKINVAYGMPGYWDPTGRVTCIGSKAKKPSGLKGTDPWCDDGVADNWYRGDSYADGDIEGNFKKQLNGAQIHWSIDFNNWWNKGVDVLH